MNNKNQQNKIRIRSLELSMTVLLAIFFSIFISCNHNDTIESYQKSTVIFNANGGQFVDGKTIKEFKVEIGDTIAKPATNPTRKDHTFVAWYETQDGSGAPYDFAKSITKNLTLYAKWKSSKPIVKKSTVRFDANGG